MNLLDFIQQRNSGEYRKVGRKDGGEYHGPCPMCGGEDRFHIWPEQNPDNEIPGSFWCRQCGQAGDVISFVMAADGLEYPAALKRLGIERHSQRSGPPRVPSEKHQTENPPASRPVTARDSNLWREKAARFVVWSADKLQGNARRLAWLKKRGIRQDTCRRFRLGWNPGDKGKDLFRSRESWGLETILKGRRRKRLWLPRGLVIPLVNSTSGIDRIRIRRFSDDEPRYYVVPGSGMDMLAIPAPVPRAAVVVESELDAILIWQEAGDLIGAVAIGTSSARPDAAAMDVLMEAELIIHAMDYDKAGAQNIALWQNRFECVERWPVPAGKDPGEAYLAGIDIRSWLMDALPPTWRSMGRLDKKSSKKKSDGSASGNGGRDGKKEGTGQVVPDPVRQLIDLLLESPVVIHHSPDRTHMREPQAWVSKHWELACRISQLIYDPVVLDWLDGFGSETIGGRELKKRGYEATRNESRIEQ